jgi:sporulation protein YlmC with PRC-barrel domain
MTWTPQTDQDYNRLQGYAVYGPDGLKIGTIDQVMHPLDEDISVAQGQHFFVVKVERALIGVLDTDDLYVPEKAVRSVSEDRVVLETTRERLPDRHWRTPPTEYRRS